MRVEAIATIMKAKAARHLDQLLATVDDWMCVDTINLTVDNLTVNVRLKTWLEPELTLLRRLPFAPACRCGP
jgi:hypothetical protein